MLKQPKTYTEQLEIIRSRKCVIDNEIECIEILKQTNYYRLSAYLLPFKNNDNYKIGTDFKTIYNIYEFDRKMRRIVFSAIEEIEIYLRSNFAYFHAHKYGTIGYKNKENYNNKHKHEKFLELINKEIKKNENSLIVKHHNNKYGGEFPVWVIMEFFTFGMLSYFYSDLTTQDKKILSHSLYKTIPDNIESWLRCCTDIRNICAHYGRLYYRIFSAIPANIPENIQKRSFFAAIIAVKSLYPDTNKWNNEILPEIKSLLFDYKAHIHLFHIGFPSDWEEILMK